MSPDPQDQAALEAFAAELREAHAPEKLSASWHRGLESLLDEQAALGGQHWSWRLSLENSPWMRAAAALLLIAVVAAPVSAVLSLMAKAEPKPLQFGFDPATPDLSKEQAEAYEQGLGLIEGQDNLHGIRPPAEEGVEAPRWSAEAILALSRSNRLAVAAQRWQVAIASGLVEPALQARAMRSAAALVNQAEGRPNNWSTATASELHDAFLARISQGTLDLPPASLFARVEELRTALDPQAQVPAGLASWHWVATGDAARGPQEGWQKAPYRPAR